MRRPLLVLTLVAATAAVWTPSVAARGGHVHVHFRPGWSMFWYGSAWYGPGWWGPGAPAMRRVRTEAPDLAVVDTDISPEHARVYLDGTLIGTADDFDGYPDYLYLRPGRYTLEFRLQGYASESVEIEAAAERYFPLDMDLERVPGEQAAPWYDRPEGLPTGRVFGPLRSPAGEPGAPPPDAGRTGPDTSLRPELRRPDDDRARPAATGAALELVVRPDTAAVYLDGEFVATATELAALHDALAVSPGTHRVEAMAPGYLSRSVEVSLGEGDRKQVVIELERAGQT